MTADLDVPYGSRSDAWREWAENLVACRALGLHCRSLGSGEVEMVMDEALYDLNPNVEKVQVKDGTRLLVQDLGSGPPVVFVSGFGLDQSLWDRQVRLLADRFRTVCVVRRGHGGPDAPLEGYELDELADDLVASLVLVSSNGVRASRSEEFPFGRPPEGTLEAMIADEERDRPGSRRRGLACFGEEPSSATVDWLFGVSMRMPSWAAVGCYRTLLMR